jgi:TPR repeat protein
MFKLIKSLATLSCLLFALSSMAEPLNEAAEQGDAKAQAKLGAMYFLGHDGIEKDEIQAFEWLMKAAKQGHIEAEVMVAAMYDRGLGVPADVNAATSWYEKAAAQGHGASLAILGKNAVAKGGVAFSYQNMRLTAAKQIPAEYAKRLLLSK